MKRLIKSITVSFIVMQILTLTAFAYEKVSNMDEMKQTIYKHFENRDNTFTIIYTGTREEFEGSILNCIKDAYSEDDYLERSWKQIKPMANQTGDGIETTLDVTYLTTKEQEEYIESELKNAVTSIISKDMSDLDKVKAINDYIINRYKYDYSEKSISVYSALTTSLAVCQGYSMTAYKMLKYAGIENRIIVGKIKDTPHSWNIVKINGSWYQLDVTNNDSIEKNKYFLVSDDVLIKEQYFWDGYRYPKAPNSFYNIQ